MGLVDGAYRYGDIFGAVVWVNSVVYATSSVAVCTIKLMNGMGARSGSI